VEEIKFMGRLPGEDFPGLQVKANVHHFNDRGKLDYTETTTLHQTPKVPGAIDNCGQMIENFLVVTLRG
jgi:hypothetical protein